MKYCLSIFLFIISLNTFSQDSTLIYSVINQLNLDQSKVHFDFVSSKICPSNPEETIVVIPEIVDEGEDFLRLKGYILIVNNETEEIINKYLEPSYWQSDAIILSEIEIDVYLYKISENNQGFGIKVSEYNRSQPNPYSNTTISLFVKSGNSLKKVLNNYDIIEYAGEWDTNCAGESINHETTLVTATNSTNGYFDILAEDIITEAKTYVDEYGECEEEEEIVSTINTVLKFNGEEYKEEYSYSKLDVYEDYSDQNPTRIKQEPNGKTTLILTEDYLTLTVTETQNGWLKVINVISVDGYDIEIPGGSGWIHCSDVGVSTRKDIELLDAPEGEIVVGIVEQETGVKIKDKYLNWVKIEYEGLSGWVKSYWLCGNPVTTCP